MSLSTVSKIPLRLSTSNLSAMTLETMLRIHGADKGTHALGAWSIYATDLVDQHPFAKYVAKKIEVSAENAHKKIVEARFGKKEPQKLERMHVVLNEVYVSSVDNEPSIVPMTIRFEGPNVLQGFKQMAQHGILDAKRIPSWMTGEVGASDFIVECGEAKPLRSANLIESQGQ